ncbi:MAG: PAS domain-containing protein [Anaerolineae bacterium]|nr:PAS domain-containing protein [Anaerolineae bacterium]
MTWHFPIYTPIFILNVLLCIWLSIMVWRRGAVPGVRVFAVMLIAAGFWSFTRLLEASVDQFWAKIFWGKIEYLGTVAIGPTWFMFTRYYRYQTKRIYPRYMLLLSIVPIITVLAAWTNEAHHLIWTDIVPSVANPEILIYGHGTWFWIAVAYNYTLLLGGIWNLRQALNTLPKNRHSQAKALLLGAMIPIAGNFLYIFALSPVKGMDLAPFFLTITGIIFFLTVFRFQLFDIRRVARAVIIDNMRDGMLVLDEKYVVVDANPSAIQLLGVSKALIEQDIRLTLAKYPAILAVITNTQSQPITLAVGDNQSLYLDIQVSELNDTLGNAAGKLVVLRDVTERHRAEKVAFETAIEQHRLQLLSQFIRDISHEFRTPLSVINTSLYLMEKSDDPLKQKSRRDAIQLQAKRLDYLISEMLTTVQLDADSPLERTVINLNSLLQTMTQEQMSIFTAKQQQLMLHTTEKPLQIFGDGFMLQKALNNILQNASRYTPASGSITVTAAAQDDFANITISDSGVGMSVETQTRIFERFFRADDAHSTPGFGLGLPIAQTIIEKHQGWIDVESTPAKGTTFIIHLPQTAAEVISLPTLELATT